MAIDASGRAPGRGAYLCRDAACWDAAGRKKAIEHALKVTMPADVLAALAAGPDGLDAVPTPTTPRADGPRPDPRPDTMPRGDAHGQE